MKISANGINMNYELTGEGRCLVLIHGFSERVLCERVLATSSVGFLGLIYPDIIPESKMITIARIAISFKLCLFLSRRLLRKKNADKGIFPVT